MRKTNVVLAALATASWLAATVPSAAVAASDDGDARTVCSAQAGRFEFGDAMPGQKIATFSSMITVSCPPHKEFRIRLRSLNNCRMLLGSEHIRYELFSDPSHTKSLLDCGADESEQEYDGRGSETFMIYGRTAALQKFLRVGTFSDTVYLEILSDRDR